MQIQGDSSLFLMSPWNLLCTSHQEAVRQWRLMFSTHCGATEI